MQVPCHEVGVGIMLQLFLDKLLVSFLSHTAVEINYLSSLTILHRDAVSSEVSIRHFPR